MEQPLDYSMLAGSTLSGEQTKEKHPWIRKPVKHDLQNAMLFDKYCIEEVVNPFFIIGDDYEEH